MHIPLHKRPTAGQTIEGTASVQKFLLTCELGLRSDGLIFCFNRDFILLLRDGMAFGHLGGIDSGAFVLAFCFCLYCHRHLFPDVSECTFNSRQPNHTFNPDSNPPLRDLNKIYHYIQDVGRCFCM